MAYSETRIVIGGLAHVPVLIFIANFIKGKFDIKTEETEGRGLGFKSRRGHDQKHCYERSYKNMK